MKRILLSAAILLAVGAFVVVAGGAGTANNQSGQYKVELDNAFGLLNGAQFKIGGVPVGAVRKVEVCKLDPGAHCQNPLHAVVTVQINQRGFTQMRSDVFCKTRPESLIGEYFLDCQPGSKGKLLPFGTTVPITHTESTIPFDLINNIMRLPYRQRFTLIINELGAAVAGRSSDLQAALRRAVPALTETDNLLNLLANDSHTLQQLTANSNTVVTALADNNRDVQRFIDEANRAATATATQQANLALSIKRLPPFLEQLKPAMARLGEAVVANEPVLRNLNAPSPPGSNKSTAGQLARLFQITPGFARSSKPALQSLGQASVTGTPAVIAARTTVKHLNQFTGQSGCQAADQAANGPGGKTNGLGQTQGQAISCLPELAQNGSIFTQDIDTQNRAVEPDSRSPGGKGFSGIQAVLQYVFNQPLAINAYSQFGHLLTVDAFANQDCSPYATPQRIANNLSSDPQTTRECYSFLGPNQPGVNETDPSNPGGCVPDPGGAPPGEPGPKTSACKLQPNPAGSFVNTGSSGSGGSSSPLPLGAAADTSAKRKSSRSAGVDLSQKLGQLFSSLGGRASAAKAAAPSAPKAAAPTADTSAGSSSPSAGQAKQLLNYLLAP